MKHDIEARSTSRSRGLATRVACALLALCLAACSDDNGLTTVSYSYKPFIVGVTTFDANLPPEPQLPTFEQVCSSVEASNLYVKRPDGALAPEADPSPAGVGVAADP